MRTFTIGDIHGCSAELQQLLATLRRKGLQPSDRLVFVGDYVDRGPDSQGVIETLLQLREEQDCVFLMGNHEEMLLAYLGMDPTGNRTGEYWLVNGGLATLQSYDPTVRITEADQIDEYLFPEAHLEFLQSLPMYYIQGSTLFVHAGISLDGCESATPEEAVALSTPEHFLWDRISMLATNYFGTMVYGHTPQRQGVNFFQRAGENKFPPYSVGVDVGTCFWKTPLAAVCIDDWSVIIGEKG